MDPRKVLLRVMIDEGDALGIWHQKLMTARFLALLEDENVGKQDLQSEINFSISQDFVSDLSVQSMIPKIKNPSCLSM